VVDAGLRRRLGGEAWGWLRAEQSYSYRPIWRSTVAEVSPNPSRLWLSPELTKVRAVRCHRGLWQNWAGRERRTVHRVEREDVTPPPFIAQSPQYWGPDAGLATDYSTRVNTDETRRLIEDYYATLPTGDRKKLRSMLTDDVAWVTPETSGIGPFHGRDRVTAELAGDAARRIFQMRTYRLTVHKLLADEDTAVVQQAVSATTRDGKQYDNEYCWVFTCRDGKIAHIVEYGDTWKAAEILGWDDAWRTSGSQ
jgi:uncharacterized protein